MKYLYTIVILLVLVACTEHEPIHSHLAPDSTTVISTNADSILLKRLVDTVKLSYLNKEEYLDENGKIDWQQVDRELSGRNMFVGDETVYYAPDSLFKIFTIGGPAGGAYGNLFAYAFFYSKDNTPLYARYHRNDEISDIKGFYIMPDHKYLIIHSYGAQVSGQESIRCIVADLVSIKNDSVKFHKVLAADSSGAAFGVCSQQVVGEYSDVPPELSYYPETNELHYTYSSHYMDYSGETSGTDTLVTGNLKYNNGIFERIDSKRQFIQPKEGN